MLKKSIALESLICELLRGGVDTSALNAKELRDYIYRAGVALHNIPHNIANDEPLRMEQLKSIDELDPTATEHQWGQIVTNIASKFGAVPAKL
tara:strand:- start:489 stop:767 length:279 start_codon:yes stop_codon:yes gene_type:complete